MTKHIKTYAILSLLSFICLLAPSCRKFLEVVPKGQQIAATVGDYDLLMNNADLYQYLYNGGGWVAPSLMGDEVAAEQNYFNSIQVNSQRMFQWAAVIYNERDNAPDLTTFLANIYICNKVINEVTGSSGGSKSQKLSLQAEAMATRAWINFQFINYYAKPYKDSVSAASDPGFPIITAADVVQTGYVRNSVQEVYNAIIKDLKSAIAGLPIENTLPTRMNKAAAEGILGKVYLFMGRTGDALPLLDAAFLDNAASSRPARLYDYNVEFGPGGSFLPIMWNGPQSPFTNFNDFTESIVAKTFTNNTATGYNGNVLTPQTAALYDSTDLRLMFYSPTYVDGSPNPGGRLRKYGVQYTKFGMELSELYLLRAECKARLNDLAGAITDVQALRQSRMPAPAAMVPAATAASQPALIRFIIDERTREFALCGYRWFDMRRLSVDPLFSGQTFTHTLYLSSGGTTLYTLDQPNRLVLQLPPNIMNSNPGFTNNP